MFFSISLVDKSYNQQQVLMVEGERPAVINEQINYEPGTEETLNLENLFNIKPTASKIKSMNNRFPYATDLVVLCSLNFNPRRFTNVQYLPRYCYRDFNPKPCSDLNTLILCSRGKGKPDG